MTADTTVTFAGDNYKMDHGDDDEPGRPGDEDEAEDGRPLPRRLQEVRTLHAKCLALAAVASLAAGPAASAPQTSKDLFKGKVKEGLYEVKSEADLSGVPGIPKEAAKRSETKQRCLTRQDIDRGIEAGKDCEVKDYRQSAGGANIVMACKDGSSTDMKFAFGGDTFSSETRTTGTHEGKSFVSLFRSERPAPGALPAAEGRARHTEEMSVIPARAGMASALERVADLLQRAPDPRWS